MSVLHQLAHLQGRRDEIPNQALARDLATRRDKRGVKEIAENVWHKDKQIQADCIKVLYEIGYLKPELIAPYDAEFIKLLASRNNRLVWGAMIALATIAELRAKEIGAHTDKIIAAMKAGSVITVDNGVKVLARVAATGDARNKKIFPYLIEHLQTCRPKEIAQHAESALPAVNAKNKQQFVDALNERARALTPAQAARIKKVIKAVEKS
ncbi:MAG: hypothetical protein HZC40_15610 [Chloroflexi bacterium]|nr:hypothetical protein [Chloroflexota bacterium]